MCYFSVCVRNEFDLKGINNVYGRDSYGFKYHLLSHHIWVVCKRKCRCIVGALSPVVGAVDKLIIADEKLLIVSDYIFFANDAIFTPAMGNFYTSNNNFYCQ